MTYSYDRAAVTKGPDKAKISEALKLYGAYVKKLEALQEVLEGDLPDLDPHIMHPAYTAQVKDALKLAEARRFQGDLKVNELLTQVRTLHRFLTENQDLSDTK